MIQFVEEVDNKKILMDGEHEVADYRPVKRL